MVDTIKFSQMMAGGDLANSDKTPDCWPVQTCFSTIHGLF